LNIRVKSSKSTKLQGLIEKLSLSMDNELKIFRILLYIESQKYEERIDEGK